MLARDAVLKLSPLIAQKNLDLEINENPAKISGIAWLIGELIRNLQIWNAGEGLPKGVTEQLFGPGPFPTSFPTHGSGLDVLLVFRKH